MHLSSYINRIWRKAKLYIIKETLISVLLTVYVHL